MCAANYLQQTEIEMESASPRKAKATELELILDRFEWR